MSSTKATSVQAQRDAIAKSLVHDLEEDAIVLRDHCFAAGTPILTPMGEKRIEEFQKGRRNTLSARRFARCTVAQELRRGSF